MYQEELCLFVYALAQSVAVEVTSEAMFILNWKCENTVSYWTESLAGFLRVYKTYFLFLGCFYV
jgi:hypothetical protein